MILDALGCGKVIVVENKMRSSRSASRLPVELAGLETVSISTLTGDGIDELRAAIRDAFLHGTAVDGREFVALSQARHRDALEKAKTALAAFHGQSRRPERSWSCLPGRLREALHAVGEVTGETTPDEVLDLIFCRFCVGK